MIDRLHPFVGQDAADAGRLWATWAIMLLCVGGFLLLNVLGWTALEAGRLSWRHIAADEVFRSGGFWRFALLATLLHTGPVHLAVNLWCLGVLGPAFERRYGAGGLLALWIVDGYLAMGCEALVGGLGRIGLSAFTYALLGTSVARWRHLRDRPRSFWTCMVMLALLAPGALDALGFGPFAPEIAHVAHATALMIGIAAELLLSRVKTSFARSPLYPCRPGEPDGGGP